MKLVRFVVTVPKAELSRLGLEKDSLSARTLEVWAEDEEKARVEFLRVNGLEKFQGRIDVVRV